MDICQSQFEICLACAHLLRLRHGYSLRAVEDRARGRRTARLTVSSSAAFALLNGRTNSSIRQSAMGRARHNVFAQSNSQRYVVIWDPQWRIIDCLRPPPGSDPRAALADAVEGLERDGWTAE